MVSVSSLVLIVDFIRLVAFRLFPWDELHCDLCNFTFFWRERGGGMSSTFLGIC